MQEIVSPTAEHQDGPRAEVALVPADSPFAGLVREAVERCGATFVPVDVAEPHDVLGRILVVDLTRVAAARSLGRRVIAISPRTDLDCYDILHPDDVKTRLRRALTNLIEVQQLRAQMRQERETLQILNELGFSLSTIPETRQLLDRLLGHARRALRADGGSIYLIEDRHLTFAAAQNDTVRFAPSRPTLPIDDSSMAGYVAGRGELLRIDDVANLPATAPFRPNLSNDAALGYRTCSALLVPMVDRDNQVFGVLALYNRKAVPGVPLADFDRVLAFTEHDADLARSIASQAAVALESHRLYQEIRALFDGFVTAAVTVIEARDPSTAGHSHRVAALTARLAREVHDSEAKAFAGVRFSPLELEELHYAAILHDFGKVGVPEQVLLKAEKLYPWELGSLELRFRLAAVQTRLEMLQRHPPEDLHPLLGLLEEDLNLVREVNRPSWRPNDADLRRLQTIGGRWVLSDRREPILSDRELSRLCIPQGSLDPDERKAIEAHVTFTYNFLKVIPWTRNLRRVPELAHAHHEKLDGSGYPRALLGDQIPYGARLMAIADIFDALTAGDRPYKSAMSVSTATRILREEAEGGRLERPAVELLIEQRLWEGILGTRGPDPLGEHTHPPGAHPR